MRGPALGGGDGGLVGMTWSFSGNSILNDTDIQRNKDIIPQTPEKT